MQQKEIALQYAKNGTRVFPCHPNTKKPLGRLSNGFHSASTDTKTITEWWSKYPNALIGSPNDQFLVIDIDNHNLCPIGMVLAESAIDALYSRNIIKENCLDVDTKSGGKHFYFKKDETVARQIFVLPSSDILGNGGYVILPDNSSYKTTTKTPWDALKNLPALDMDAFATLIHDFTEVTSQARELKKIHKLKQPAAVKKKKAAAVMSDKKRHKTRNLSDYPKKVEKSFIFDNDELKHTKRSKDAIDYDTGEITFKQDKDMYKSRAKKITTPEFVVEFDENGYLKLDKPIDTDVINALFYNTEVQTRLAELMGIRVPPVGKRGLQRSILPTHADEHPSMGIRWNEGKTHIIIRDFSNHYADSYNQVDYNVVRLYATCQYNALVPRMKPPEFVVWFLRMLVEANIIDVSARMKKYGYKYSGIASTTQAKIKVADGLLFLDAIKSLYKGYDGVTVYSDRFASAWAGVDPSTAQSAKRWMLHVKLVNHRGYYDCSKGKRADGFFETKLYSINTFGDITLPNPLNKHKRKKANELMNKKQLAQYNKQLEEENGMLTTSIEVIPSSEIYDKLVAFAEDYKIKNIPSRRNMIFGAGAGVGDYDLAPTLDGMTLIADKLYLHIAERMNEGVQTHVLLIGFESPSLEDVFFKYQSQFEQGDEIGDEPMMVIPLSYDVEMMSDKELDKLEVSLREYVGKTLQFSDIKQRYCTFGQFNNMVLDGVPIED